MSRPTLTRALLGPDRRTRLEQHRLCRDLVIHMAHDRGCSLHLLATAFRLSVGQVHAITARVAVADRTARPARNAP